jgi:hypothetical protein
MRKRRDRGESAHTEHAPGSAPRTGMRAWLRAASDRPFDSIRFDSIARQSGLVNGTDCDNKASFGYWQVLFGSAVQTTCQARVWIVTSHWARNRTRPHAKHVSSTCQARAKRVPSACQARVKSVFQVSAKRVPHPTLLGCPIHIPSHIQDLGQCKQQTHAAHRLLSHCVQHSCCSVTSDCRQDALNALHNLVPHTHARCDKCHHDKVLSAAEVLGYLERKATGTGDATGIPCNNCNQDGHYFVTRVGG